MHELIYLERGGAIYRGYRTDSPIEVWDQAMQIWQPFTPDGPIPAGWARQVTSRQALSFMNCDELTKTEAPPDAAISSPDRC